MEPPIPLFRITAAGRGRPPSCFQTSEHGLRIGLGETGAGRTPSNPSLLLMLPVPNTRTALKTRPWCSTPSGEEATPGPAASRCRNGSPGPRAPALTPRARCGRSFVSIRFQGSSKAGRPTRAEITWARPPNPRLQRTRFALLRSPLSRKPLDRGEWARA